MPKIDPALKEKLLEQGQWGDFVKYRDELKVSGVPGKEAHHQAMDKFFENLPASPKKARGKGKKKKSAKSPPDAAENGSIGGEAAATVSPPLTPSETTVKIQTGRLPELPEVHSADFDGKQASEVEAIRWVASNMEIVDPDPVDCPSAAAWGLLSQCRKSLLASADFWKQTFPKLLPSRAQMETERDTAPDESKAKEIIDDLLRFGKEAKEEAMSPSTEDKPSVTEKVEEAGAFDVPSMDDELAPVDEDGMEIVEDEEVGSPTWEEGKF